MRFELQNKNISVIVEATLFDLLILVGIGQTSVKIFLP